MDKGSPGKIYRLETIRMALYCRDRCPVCRRGRTRGGVARLFVEHLGEPLCPCCRAYEEVFGRPAHESVPAAAPRERKYSTRSK